MSKETSQGNMKSFTCPKCGWMVKSPYGENDVVEPVKMHARNHHPELANLTNEQIVSMEKNA